MPVILASPNTEIIDKKIKDILARGNIVCFTNKITGTVKHVTEWNQDAEGDLIASYSTGSNNFVCTYAIEYEISEIEKPRSENG